MKSNEASTTLIIAAFAAFADSDNRLVKAVKKYKDKARTVKGGLGTGGTLGVQGGLTPASQEVGKDTGKKPVTKKAPAKKAAR